MQKLYNPSKLVFIFFLKKGGMVVGKIRTRWFESAQSDVPLPDYPRPQFVRSDWQCLNGVYNYEITSADASCPQSFDGKILVPFSIESQLSGVEKSLSPDELLWYKRSFTITDTWAGRRILLHFGAVDWKCTVFVNGKDVGSHVGGYNPFSFDITDCLKQGENELIVKVYDPTDKGWQQRGKQVLEPHGFWYTATSGIWQTVWLEPVNKNRIEAIKLLPDIDNKCINIQSSIICDTDYRLVAKISDCKDAVFSGEIGLNESVPIRDIKLWSPEEPFLYDLILELYCGDTLCDTVSSYFGMRKYSIGKDKEGLSRLLLNNESYFHCGLLDQGYWCDGGLTPPTDEAMVYDIQRMKDFGFNMLRKHIKVEPLRWYYHCDRIGMIVWQDMVSGGEYIGTFLAGILPNIGVKVKDNAYKRFKRGERNWRNLFEEELFGMIDNLFNSTSIGCWVPFNEGWGQFDAKRIGAAIKEYDSSRLIDHASGWYDQGGGDFNSVHKYILPVRKPKADGRPFVLSEFGGYSNIVENHVWNKAKSFGYRMYGDKLSLTEAYKKLMKKQIIPLIKKGLSATVYTQVSDVEFEVNGLMTYDREVVKIDEKVINDLNLEMRSEIKK